MSYINRDFYEITHVNGVWYKVEVFYITGDLVRVAIHKEYIGNIISYQEDSADNVRDLHENVGTYITLAVL